MILFLILAISAPHLDQAKHDRDELAMWSELQRDREQIEAIWLPSRKLVHSYEKAHDCYVKFHLYKVQDCDRERVAVTERLKAEQQ
jgi:hypothetical protein